MHSTASRCSHGLRARQFCRSQGKCKRYILPRCGWYAHHPHLRYLLRTWLERSPPPKRKRKRKKHMFGKLPCLTHAHAELAGLTHDHGWFGLVVVGFEPPYILERKRGKPSNLTTSCWFGSGRKNTPFRCKRFEPPYFGEGNGGLVRGISASGASHRAPNPPPASHGAPNPPREAILASAQARQGRSWTSTPGATASSGP